MRDLTIRFLLASRLRSVTYRFPSGIGPKGLIVGLHGGGGNGLQFERQTDLTGRALASGYVVAWADGTGLGDHEVWNDGLTGHAAGVDDVSYFDHVVAHAKDHATINTRRIYVVGFSEGAMMGWRLLAERSSTIAAACLASGSVPNLGAKQTRGVPVRYFHGSLDLWVPIEGGPSKYDRTVSHSMVESLEWAGRKTRDVEGVVVAGGGHQWFGGTPIVVPGTEPFLDKPDISQAALDWFETRRL